VAVLPFAAPAGYPTLGEEAADLTSQELDEVGFTLVDRMDIKRILEEQKLSMTGAVKGEEAAQLGKILGVEAIVTGTIGEASQHTVHHPAVYAQETDASFDNKGKWREKPKKTLVNPAENISVAIFSATVRVIDVDSGSLLWVGSGSDQAENVTIQEVGTWVLHGICRDMGAKFISKKL
jgi:hypothetical protein